MNHTSLGGKRFISVVCHPGSLLERWTGMVEWNSGIANSAKMRSRGYCNSFDTLVSPNRTRHSYILTSLKLQLAR